MGLSLWEVGQGLDYFVSDTQMKKRRIYTHRETFYSMSCFEGDDYSLIIKGLCNDAIVIMWEKVCRQSHFHPRFGPGLLLCLCFLDDSWMRNHVQ